MRNLFSVNGDNIRLNESRFYQYLHLDMGYTNIKYDDKLEFVKINEKIISSTNLDLLVNGFFDELRSQNFIYNRRNRTRDVENYVRRRISTLFLPNQLKTLTAVEPEFLDDDEHTSYLFYKNGVFKVSSDRIVKTEYRDLTKYVWKNQIIDRELNLNNEIEDGVFYQFVKKLSGDHPEKFNSLRSIIGYLLHRYKDPVTPKAVILYDEDYTDQQNGGTGKSLLSKSLGYIRKQCVKDGPNINMENQFSYSDVQLGTNIILIDDVAHRFNFTNLFSVLSNGLPIRRLYQDLITIPYEQSPKFMLTSNFVVAGMGDSHDRRKIEFEISRYFNRRRTPLNEYGSRFFISWDKEEWSKFDNFMIDCIQYYLQNGVVEVDPVYVRRKRIIRETCEEFVEFIENWLDETDNYRVAKNHLYDDFITSTGVTPKSKIQFTKWVNTYCNIMEINLSYGQGNQYYVFSK